MVEKAVKKMSASERLHLDIIHGPLRALAQRYDVRLVALFEQGAPPIDTNPRASCGPQGDYLLFDTRTVAYDLQAQAEGVLHEVVHCILGPSSTFDTADEGYLLMPFEWALACWIARRLSGAKRFAFVDGVRRYQDQTSIGAHGVLFLDSKGGRNGSLWKDGLRRARAMGLLDEQNALTFRLPRRGRRVPPDGWYKKHFGAVQWATRIG